MVLNVFNRYKSCLTVSLPFNCLFDKLFRLNPVTRKHEPFVPMKRKVIRFSFTSGVIIFMVSKRSISDQCSYIKSIYNLQLINNLQTISQLSAVMLGVVSVIAFRLILIATMFQATKTFPEFFQKYARVMATGVAAFINAIIIEVKYLSMMVHHSHVSTNK